MGSYAIRARFDSDVEPESVGKWLVSTEGISGWWSDTVEGAASAVGDEFVIRFPTTDVPFSLVVRELDDDVVVWDVPESPPWWKGTTIRFEVGGGPDGGTSLLFVHEGFEPSDPIIEVITPAWIGFVNNLMEVAATGQASPAVIN